MRTVSKWTGEIEYGCGDGRLLCDHVCGSTTLFAYLLCRDSLVFSMLDTGQFSIALSISTFDELGPTLLNTLSCHLRGTRGFPTKRIRMRSDPI